MRLALLPALVCITACTAPPESGPRPDDPKLARQDSLTVLSRESVTGGPTGVSIDSAGVRYLWVPAQGVMQLERTGPQLILDAAWVEELASSEDLAVIDSQRVALISQNEGIIVERTTGRRLSRFCYLPGSVRLEDPIAWQFSRALSYDPQEDRLYVQPQTFPGGGTTPNSSQVGLFDPRRDEPLEWLNISQPSFSAGGMAVESRERTWLGMGTRLFLYDARSGEFTGWWDLTGTVSSIEGLAFDRQKKSLVVLDQRAQQLVELGVDGLQ